MSKYFKIFIPIIFTLILLSESLNAAESGNAEVYKVTMTLLEFCTDAKCNDYYIVCSDEKTVNIASVLAGAEIGSWCSTSGLSIGMTYSHVRVHVKRTFTMKGFVEDNVGTKECFTQDNTTASYTRTAPGGLTDDAATLAARVEQSVTLVNANGVDAINVQGGTNTYTFSNSAAD